jgi:hypothetical protein
MLNSLKKQTRHAFEVALAFSPWLISTYILYWLESGEIWTTDTAHRGKTTVAILAIGMGLSLFVHSRLTRREQK